MTTYKICLEGHLDPRWKSEFPGFNLAHDYTPGGRPFTTLLGPLPDQSALYGALTRLRNLGAALISVQPQEEN